MLIYVSGSRYAEAKIEPTCKALQTVFAGSRLPCTALACKHMPCICETVPSEAGSRVKQESSLTRIVDVEDERN
eukprot:6177994-Pleurochrysis_carterae.AAC.4